MSPIDAKQWLSSIADKSYIQAMRTRIQNPVDLGNAIKEARKARKWSQSALASRIGVSRQWLVEMEQGKKTAEIGLILRTLSELNLPVLVGETAPGTLTAKRQGPEAPNLDEILARAKGLR